MSILEREYELKMETAKKSQLSELGAIEIEHQINIAKSDAKKNEISRELEIEEMRNRQAQMIFERQQLDVDLEKYRKKAEADV